MYNHLLTKFADKYAKDLIIECVGQEARFYAEDFKITETFYNKFKTRIEDNIELIKGKHVIDVGSGTGVWAVLMLMVGAKSVTCVEPRLRYSQGLGRFAEKHSLPIVSVCDFHYSVLEAGNHYDTMTLFGLLELIPDPIAYLSRVHKVADHVIIKNFTSSEFSRDTEVPDNGLLVEYSYNMHPRAGFDFHKKNFTKNDLGIQTDLHTVYSKGREDKPGDEGVFLLWFFGRDFFRILLESMGHQVLKDYGTKPYDHRITVAKFNKNKNNIPNTD